MNVETATNMHDLRKAVNWLAKNIDRDELDADNEVEQAYFDFCMRILPNAGHILNDSVGYRTARDYLTFPGKDPEELEDAMQTLQRKLRANYSIAAEPYLGKAGHRYYKSQLSEWPEEAKKIKDQYHVVGSLMNRAAKKIEFDNLKEETEFYEVLTSIFHSSERT